MSFFVIQVNYAGTTRPTSRFPLPVITAINVFASLHQRLENYPLKPKVLYPNIDDFVLSL